jgi:hypothetical protein
MANSQFPSVLNAQLTRHVVMMKKLMVTYQVKAPVWWLLNNQLEQTTAHSGFRFELTSSTKSFC